MIWNEAIKRHADIKGEKLYQIEFWLHTYLPLFFQVYCVWTMVQLNIKKKAWVNIYKDYFPQMSHEETE